MICQKLKKLAVVTLMLSGLTACAQVDSPSQLAQSSSSGKMSNSKLGLSHASTNVRLFGVQSTPVAAPMTSSNGQHSLFTSAAPMLDNGDLWSHVRADFQLPAAADKPEVQEQIRWYMHHQQYLNRVITRAAPYMYYILERAQERDLPAELVLLPIMESAYNPFANSCRGAAGLWQLMSPTASIYGVKQDWWYDGRRDIYASTNAALDYLTYLQSYFGGDWLLAIGAYDAGEGGIQMSVRRNARAGRPTDFWSLQLPAETRSYVPRLLALASIINNPAKYSITLPRIDDRPYMQQVDIGVPIKLTDAARLANMNVADLKQLNPAFSHSMTGPNGPYRLLLPIDRIPTFKENLANAPSLARTIWGSYKVKHGDSLASIAKKYNTTVVEIAEANLIKGHKAPVGKVIMIPTGTEMVKPHLADDTDDANTPAPAQLAAANPVASPAPQQNNQPAPTAAPVQAAAATASGANPLATANSLVAVQNTIEPSAVANLDTTDNSSAAAPTAPQKTLHTIKPGETLSKIARQYNVKISDLQRWNNIKGGKGLKPGNKLVIQQAAPTSSVVKTASSRSSNSHRNHSAHAAPAKASTHASTKHNLKKHHGSSKTSRSQKSMVNKA